MVIGHYRQTLALQEKKLMASSLPKGKAGIVNSCRIYNKFKPDHKCYCIINMKHFTRYFLSNFTFLK